MLDRLTFAAVILIALPATADDNAKKMPPETSTLR